jgi:hypothetical protein
LSYDEQIQQADVAHGCTHHDGPGQALVVELHVVEGVLFGQLEVAHEVHVRLHAPVPVKPRQERVVKEETAKVPAVDQPEQLTAVKNAGRVGEKDTRAGNGYKRLGKAAQVRSRQFVRLALVS